MRIGIDTGGTFTDFVVLHNDSRVTSFKLRSNPAAPAEVILEGLRRIAAGSEAESAEVVHGSTVATNALLERKGARTAFVTTCGFEDLVAIGRQNRPELYNLTPPLPVSLVRRELCFGVDERILTDGTIERALDAGPLSELLAASGVESVAICLLHSYRNDAHERALLSELENSGLYISASCDISPEFREFERASTTVINAYVGPLMDRYLGDLERLSPYPVSIMQSNGGLLTAAEARCHAVRTILSGPAGGVVGAVEIARARGLTEVLTFDMGGTSTDVALAGIEPRLTTEARIEGLPVRVSMLDINTVGAGGGSIAWVDSGGSLRVGPRSAGASPGPACYGTGTDATVTDAHVVLGRIAADQLTGGEMTINPPAASAAVARVGSALGMSMIAAAEAVIRVANSNMERAIRAVSVERGEDPRGFALVAFGGSGGLHACEIADELGIRTVIVPHLAGALSALGMLVADRTRDYAAGALGIIDIESLFENLERRALADVPGSNLTRFADLRYPGQSYELTVPWLSASTTGASTSGAFHRRHQQVYGYSEPQRATETVTVRLRATLLTTKPALASQHEHVLRETSTTRRIRISGKWLDTRIYTRRSLDTGRPGPLLIIDYGATTLVPVSWSAAIDETGSLVLTR